MYILIRKMKPTEAKEVGNWYPDHYENTGKFRKDLGIQAWVNWVRIFLFTFVSNILSPYYLFFNYVYTICYMLLIFGYWPYILFQGLAEAGYLPGIKRCISLQDC